MTTRDPIYFLRIRNGLDVIRIAKHGLSIAGNDFNHSDWNLETSCLSVAQQEEVHDFCTTQGLLSPDWSAMAMRYF